MTEQDSLPRARVPDSEQAIYQMQSEPKLIGASGKPNILPVAC